MNAIKRWTKKRTSRPMKMGTLLDGRGDFLLHEEDLWTHALVAGKSGKGKTKLLELLQRYLMSRGCGFTLIDPHGDQSEDLLAFARYLMARKGRDDVLPKIHYLEPSYEQVFCYQPFLFRPAQPIPDAQYEAAHRSWLHTKVRAVMEVLQRKQNQSGFEGMPRLERILTDVLTGVGSAVRGKGSKARRLPLSDALVLLDVYHDRHADVYECVAPKLDGDLRSDFQRLQMLAKRSPDAVLRETESTMNRLRSFLSPVVKGIFCDQVESIDFRSIIQNGEILLVNLRQTNYFSADQSQAIGGLFIHELLSAALNEPRETRKRHYLIVDEAGEFIGEDIGRALAIMRKFLMPIILAIQNLSTLVKGETDLRPRVLSQCDTIITFQQRLPEDTEILTRVIGTGNLDFRKHYQVMDRPDGHEFMTMREYARNFTWSNSWNNGFSVSRSQGRSLQVSHSEAQGNAVANGDQWSSDQATTKSSGETENIDRNALRGGGSLQKTAGLSERKGQGGSLVRTENNTSTDGTARGLSQEEGEAENWGNGGSEGGGVSESQKTAILPRTREERHETPSLMNQVSDQLELMRQQMHGFGPGEAVALVADQTVALAFQTAFVDEKWVGADKFAEIEEAKKMMPLLHPYFAAPQIGQAAQDERLARFLGAEDESEADVPLMLPASPPEARKDAPVQGADGSPFS